MRFFSLKLISVFFIFALVFAWLIFFPFKAVQLPIASRNADLTVLAYSSLLDEGGLLSQIQPEFERRCGCRIRFISGGDAQQLTNYLHFHHAEKGGGPDVVVGLDQLTWARSHSLFNSLVKGHTGPSRWSQLAIDLGAFDGFVPFDYGVMAFLGDLKKMPALKATPPYAIKDFLTPQLRRSVIVQDPRTSTPGLLFTLFLKKILGNGFVAFMQNFREQVLTFTPGWSGSYSLFLKEEAPLVWSYTTSLAYHLENPQKDEQEHRYTAVYFKEGNPIQVEGAALVKKETSEVRRVELGQMFLDFLMSDFVQAKIPKTQWMMPIIRTEVLSASSVVIPSSFLSLPKPEKIIFFDSSFEEIEQGLREWNLALHLKENR